MEVMKLLIVHGMEKIAVRKLFSFFPVLALEKLVEFSDKIALSRLLISCREQENVSSKLFCGCL